MMKKNPLHFLASRRYTRQVKVGSVGIGGQNPLRIQSMLTSDTRDVSKSVEQIIKLKEAGCDIVRLTVQGMKEAFACQEIKNTLVKKNIDVPLVADIHFYPKAAMTVLDFVDKVRINPGNFADKRASLQPKEYDEDLYKRELEKVEEKFTPLVLKCKAHKKAMRIGTNQGSLSDRILNRYGDTPQGMLVSAMEYAQICRKLDFHSLIFSMKSSNALVMIQAYRLLCTHMDQLGWDYPVHLGVTEAGFGEDGRIKSSVGIGTLLLDGIGDTLRVSLTEDPWFEVDPCRRLSEYFQKYAKKAFSPWKKGIKPFFQSTRPLNSLHLSEKKLPSCCVMLSMSADALMKEGSLEKLGFLKEKDSYSRQSTTADILHVQGNLELIPEKLLAFLKSELLLLSEEKYEGFQPFLSLGEYSYRKMTKPYAISFPSLGEKGEDEVFALLVDNTVPKFLWEEIRSIKPQLIILSLQSEDLLWGKDFFSFLEKTQISSRCILSFDAQDLSWEDCVIYSSTLLGSFLCENRGEGVWMRSQKASLTLSLQLSFSLLQASRKRFAKTEFISCPSCGRTLFDLQEVSKRIRDKTAHLPGVKIAIMGCIVNGPGEMADADFGYVGSRPGKVDLYVGKKCVERSIDFSCADERLIALIKKEGCWVDPKGEKDLALAPS